mmetsp:Transcript_27376/g.80518  ORF Transcript_27376/g.80518 Transcript_27376/m.80518 type:complete len:200 (+) Transcript_27376:1-600(+)
MTATFSAGDPRFLQKAFDSIKYLGVTFTQVGNIAIGGESPMPAILVTYDSGRISYKRLLGTFWRNVDPTRTAQQGQFGGAGPTVIWASSEAEREVAAESKRRLEASGLFKRAPLVTEVRLLPDVERDSAWQAGGEIDQEWYSKDPKAFEKALASTGRRDFFDRTYRPVKTTACEGSVCGYVYFPCSDENGCLAVMNGSW